MKKSIRHLFMALSVLASGGAVASCGSEAPSPEELGQLNAELRVGDFALELEALEGDDPDPSSDCDCGPLISWPPPSCERSRWFCNAVGDCSCELPSRGLLQNTTDVMAQDRALSSGAPAARLDGAATFAAREMRRDIGASDEPPVRDDSDDCKCAGATVSAPQGGCALVDWYCNASGLCRCRH